MGVEKVVVECENLLAKLEAKYPNLMKQASQGFWNITSAGARFTMDQLAATAKSHDSDEDNHTVHRN